MKYNYLWGTMWAGAEQSVGLQDSEDSNNKLYSIKRKKLNKSRKHFS